LAKFTQSTLTDGKCGHWEGTAVSVLSCVVSTLQLSLETVPAILFGGQYRNTDLPMMFFDGRGPLTKSHSIHNIISKYGNNSKENEWMIGYLKNIITTHANHSCYCGCLPSQTRSSLVLAAKPNKLCSSGSIEERKKTEPEH